jgi:peptidoglycan/LPS O-acetylase OafA/YrhL
VVFFHCFIYSTIPLNFQGSSLMPLFYLLTGLTHALVYNKLFPTEEELRGGFPTTSLRSFYQNRLVRVVPVYLLTSFGLAMPLGMMGWGDSAPNSDTFFASIGTTLTFTSTLFIFILGSPLDGPAWTVQTFIWLWLVFPWAMRSTRKKRSEELASGLTTLYWVQLVVLFLAFYVLAPFLTFWPAFAAATMHPITRYPLFLMGIYAGELLKRASTDPTLKLSALWPQKLLLFPCSACCCARPPSSTFGGTNGGGSYRASMDDDELAKDKQFWTRSANWASGWLFLLTLLVFAADTAVAAVGGGGINGAVWFQAVVPFLQLELLVALTYTRTDSLLFRALTTRVARYLGLVSMTIYLVHYPLIYWLCFWANGNGRPLAGPSESASESEKNEFAARRVMPAWGIIVIPAVTLVLAPLIYHLFEEPVRRSLKS